MYKTKFIMEIGSNHNQDWNRFLKFVDEAKSLGFWGIKLQLFDPNKLYSNATKKQIQDLESKQLPIEWLPKIKEVCKKNKLQFICSPFYNEAVDILRPWIDAYKISSYDTLRIDLVQACANTKKPLFISNGLIAPSSLFYLYAILYNNDKNILKNIITMSCISQYPAKQKDFYVKEFEYLRIYGTKIGYSDHTVNNSVILDSILNGAEYIELHYDLMDNNGLETKHKHCWNSELIKQLHNDTIAAKCIKNKQKLLKQRYQKADMSDGLRPMKKIR